MKVLDTNALISFVTDRNLKQQKKIVPLIEEAVAQGYLIEVIIRHWILIGLYIGSRARGVARPCFDIDPAAAGISDVLTIEKIALELDELPFIIVTFLKSSDINLCDLDIDKKNGRRHRGTTGNLL